MSKKNEPDATAAPEWDGPEWVLPEDREAYDTAYAAAELDKAGFGSRAEYEGRTEMDRLVAEQEKAKRPDPRPGDAEYEWEPHYPEGAALFRYTFADGTFVALRKFADIYSKAWLYKIRNLQTDSDFQFASIDRGSCETAQDVLAAIDAPLDAPDPFEELWTAWTAPDTSHGDGDKGLDSGE